MQLVLHGILHTPTLVHLRGLVNGRLSWELLMPIPPRLVVPLNPFHPLVLVHDHRRSFDQRLAALRVFVVGLGLGVVRHRVLLRVDGLVGLVALHAVNLSADGLADDPSWTVDEDRCSVIGLHYNLSSSVNPGDMLILHPRLKRLLYYHSRPRLNNLPSNPPRWWGAVSNLRPGPALIDSRLDPLPYRLY